MDVNKLLSDPVQLARIILADYVQGNKYAVRFVDTFLEQLPEAEEARGAKKTSQKVDSVTSAGKTQEAVSQKPVKIPFWKKFVPIGIYIGGFIIGFFIVLPLVSMGFVPIYGFFAGLAIFLGSIYYAKIWKDENLPPPAKKANAGL